MKNCLPVVLGIICFAKGSATAGCPAPELAIEGSSPYVSEDPISLQAGHVQGATIEFKVDNRNTNIYRFGPDNPYHLDAPTKGGNLSEGETATHGSYSVNQSGQWRIYAQARVHWDSRTQPTPTATSDGSAPGVSRSRQGQQRCLRFGESRSCDVYRSLPEGQEAPGGTLTFAKPGQSRHRTGRVCGGCTEFRHPSGPTACRHHVSFCERSVGCCSAGGELPCTRHHEQKITGLDSLHYISPALLVLGDSVACRMLQGVHRAPSRPRLRDWLLPGPAA